MTTRRPWKAQDSGGMVADPVGDVAGQSRQERLGQALAGLAVAAGVGRAGRQAAGDAPGQQAGHGPAAGVVVGADLGEEDGGGRLGGEEAVAGGAGLLGDDAGELAGSRARARSRAGSRTRDRKRAAD